MSTTGPSPPSKGFSRDKQRQEMLVKNIVFRRGRVRYRWTRLDPSAAVPMWHGDRVPLSRYQRPRDAEIHFVGDVRDLQHSHAPLNATTCMPLFDVAVSC